MRRNFSSRAPELSGGKAIILSIPKSGRTWIRTFLYAYFCKRYGREFTLEPEHYSEPGIPRFINQAMTKNSDRTRQVLPRTVISDGR